MQRMKSSGMKFEIDRYRHLSLMVVEGEFSSVVEVNLFELPTWFGAEISSDKRYSNKALWKQLNQ
ncbi:hypothetical protein J26TS2_07750 [Shouchella clausii]|nr:hypothetical protein J26TS2_07750 [Shouchella clausii]